MVISEHRKSYYWKTSAQISQKMGFGKDNATIADLRKTSAQISQKMGFGKDNATIADLRKHILLISCLMIEIYTVGLFCSARVAIELRTV